MSTPYRRADSDAPDDDPHERIEAHPPISWVAVSTGAFVVACALVLGVLARKSALALLFFVVVAGAFAFWTFRAARPPRIVLRPEGIVFEGREALFVRWDELAELGAGRIGVSKDSPLVRFDVYLRDESVRHFTSDWTNAARVAAALQARSLSAVNLDLPRALANTPRGDASEALGADAATRKRFVIQVRAALAALGIDAWVSEDRLRAERDDGKVYELFALARRCLTQPEDKWPKVIRKHFKTLERAQRESHTLFESAPTYEDLLPRLRVQVWRAGEHGEGTVKRRLTEALVIMVVVDFEEFVAPLPSHLVASWNKSDISVVDAVLERMRQQEPAKDVALDNGPIRVIRGKDVAARAAEVSSLTQIDDRYGALVGIPSSDALVILPLANAADLMLLMMGTLPRAITEIGRRAERPPSTDVFWWFRGELTVVPALPLPQGLTWLVPDGLSGRLTGRVSD